MSSDEKKQKFMMELCDHFKAYVVNCIDEGHHENFDDHLLFLEQCFIFFLDMELRDRV